MASSPRQRLLEFSRHFAAGRYEAALEIVDALVAEHPHEGPIRWQRARTLEKLGRWEEARLEVKRVLELRREFAPAWVMRAELGEAEGEYDPEPDLRRAIALDPKNARARYLLGVTLSSRDNAGDEARAQMDQALELDPALHEAWAARAGWSRIEAWTDEAGPETDPSQVVVTFSGTRFKRVHLERALADFERAIAIAPEPSYRFARGDLLHTLGRHDEALAELDDLLASLPPDHSLRPLAEQARREPEGEAIARATDDLVPDTPEEMAAVSIAWQIRQMAQEAQPEYAPVDPSGFPGHQRRFAAGMHRQLVRAGFAKLGDYDPVHLSAPLARKQMVTIYVRADGRTTAAVFSIKPPWSGFRAWLALFVKGRHRPANVVELETAFSDGTVVSTSNAGATNPFGQGPRFLQEKLATATAPAAILERHEARVDEYAAAHPAASVIEIRTIEEVTAQQARQVAAKNAYRRSIGFVSDEELRAVMGEQYDRVAPKVREKLRLMAGEPA